ncbi:hypothetical protein, partial [Clostridium perfringens]|uniref:hypothetical protein n=1 Tax=Clostridium perfringens TaxID=1502 RepID=UPI00375489B8
MIKISLVLTFLPNIKNRIRPMYGNINKTNVQEIILIDKFKKFRGERIDISNDVQEKQLKVKIVDVILLVIRECVV